MCKGDILKMINKLKRESNIFDFIQIIGGATLVALAYNSLLLPSKIAAGGISGVSTVLFEMYGFSPAIVQFLINIPIFILGWFILGKEFSGKSLIGTIWVPFIIFITAGVPPLVSNPFLGTIYGGVILGIGLGIVYRGNGSTGGTAALAQVLKKLTGLSSGYSQLIVDSLVVGSSLFVFNIELALYALMCIFITSKTIDYVQLSTSSSKLILIITEEEERIQSLIQTELDRGLTKVNSVGGYSNEDKTMILCVAEQDEAVQLKKLLLLEEPSSFVVFINTSDIMGRGFSLDKYYGQKL